MVTVVTREANGIPLTHDQVDDNFTGLADAINNLGDDVLAPAIAAKDAAVSAASAAQTSALSASNSANAASISSGAASTSAESASTSASEASASAASAAGQIAEFSALQQTDAGSVNTGWKQSGAGAILENVDAALLRAAVNPFSFGGTGLGSTGNDTTAVLNAVAEAKASNRALDMTGGVGWVMYSNVDFTGITALYFNHNAPLVDRRTSPSGFLASYGTDTGDPHTGRAQGTICGIMAAYREDLATPADGIFLKFSTSNVGHIRAYGFKGHGIFGDDLWDSTILRLSTELCGTPAKKGLHVSSNDGDTSNTMYIGAIQCEQARDGGIFLDLVRSEVGPIHAERTYITTTDDGSAPNTFGKRYTNHYISLGNSSIGQGLFDAVPAGTAVPGGGVTVSDEVEMRTFLDASDTDHCIVGGGFTISGGVGGGGRSITCKNFQAISPATKKTFVNLKVEQVCKVETGIVFINPDINTFSPYNGASNLHMYGGSITAQLAYSNTVGANINYTDVLIAEVGDTRNDGTTFNNCQIASFVGGFNAAPLVIGGNITATSLVSQSKARFLNVRGGTFNYSGNNGYITRGCQYDTVTNWALPSNVAWPAGTLTERPNYVSGQGALYVNKNGAISWGAITTFPV